MSIKPLHFVCLGELDNSVNSYEQALRREAEFPNVQTQACPDLPFLIATTPLRDKFDQAIFLLAQFSDRPAFPVETFRWNAAYALILAAQMRDDQAYRYAQSALEATAKDHSGFRYRQDLGLVADQYQNVVQELSRIAGTACPYARSAAVLHLSHILQPQVPRRILVAMGQKV